MRTIRSLLAVAAATATMTAGLLFPTAGTAQAAVQYKTISFKTMRAGDCTMFQGATWTLGSDGSARFDAIVTSSDDNDAWLMWPHLQDAYRAELGFVYNWPWPSSGHNKFVINLPHHTERYHWRPTGTFNPRLFGAIRHMALDNRC
jgi:hypothetical protein